MSRKIVIALAVALALAVIFTMIGCGQREPSVSDQLAAIREVAPTAASDAEVRGTFKLRRTPIDELGVACYEAINYHGLSCVKVQ
jgi:hypothetical protein